MRITISGTPGSGKSVIARELAKRLKLKRYSMGNFMREIARKRKISLMKLTKIAEKSDMFDKELDRKQIDLKYKDNFVIDGRISFYFIPNSIKVFLKADLNTRAKRIFNDKRKDEHFSTLSAVKNEIRQRQESERRRYLKFYNINYWDKKHYNYILDTTGLTAEESTDKLISFIKKHKIKNLK